MPNNITNIIRARENVIQEIIQRFTTMDEGYLRLDFEKIIPQDEKIYKGNIPISMATVKVAVTEEEKKALKKIKKLYALAYDRGATEGERQAAMYKVLDLAAANNFDLNAMKLPVKTWYDNNVDKWGTKWNAYECDFEKNEIRFETAWSMPLPIIYQLSKFIGNKEMEISYADEDIGYNCGQFEICDGIIKNEANLERGSKEAIIFALKTKNRDIDEYFREMEECEEEERENDEILKLT